MKLHQKLQELAAAVAAGGGRLYVVGGWVRDFRLGRPSSDVDCEVHRISSVQLLELLNEEGSVARVGRSFGVYKWSVAGECFDVHLVESSGSLQESVDGAIQRRDFCCNALLFDPLNEQILDRVGGLEDIEEKRLRVVNPSRFGEDALRGLRGPRFAATLGFSLQESARELCRIQDLREVPGERIWGELQKLLTGRWADRGWSLLGELGQLEQLFPETEGLQCSESEPRLVRLTREASSLQKSARLALALTVVTLAVPDVSMKGVFDRLKVDKVDGVSLRGAVGALRAWLSWTERHGMDDEAILRMAEELPVLWGSVLSATLHPELQVEDLMNRAEALGVSEGPLAPLLSGQDLLDRGLAAGSEIGRLLRRLRELQLSGRVTTRAMALAWLEQEISGD